MPIVSLTKTLPPIHLDRTIALTVDCEKLYIQAVQRAGTEDVQIVVQPGNTAPDGSWMSSHDIQVPRLPVKLGDLFPDRYQECVVKARYTYGGATGLDPSERMTRQEFVMQTLDIWERLLLGMQAVSRRTSDTENNVVAGMELLKSTYSFQEMMPEGFDLEKFKALFEPSKENSDGTTA